jgi:hypothetical protein
MAGSALTYIATRATLGNIAGILVPRLVSTALFVSPRCGAASLQRRVIMVDAQCTVAEHVGICDAKVVLNPHEGDGCRLGELLEQRGAR